VGRQGGKKNRRWKLDGSDLPTIPLKHIDDLIGLLEETINRIRALAVIRPEFFATIS
jgi:hypothetical protein